MLRNLGRKRAHFYFFSGCVFLVVYSVLHNCGNDHRTQWPLVTELKPWSVSDPRNNTLQLIALDGYGVHCLNTSTSPPFPVCVYSPQADRYVSAQLLQEGLWEPEITTLFQQALLNYPEATVLDLGSHVGYYSLMAATLGHSVLAVDPVVSSLFRLALAMQLSNTSHQIRLIHHAMAAERKWASLVYKKGNLGGTSIRLIEPDSSFYYFPTTGTQRLHQPGNEPPTHPPTFDLHQKQKGKSQGNEKTGPSTRDENVRTIRLDDIVPLIGHRVVVLKVDIEGYECAAIAGGHGLLDHFFIPYIFMEWSVMFQRQHKLGAPCRTPHLQAMITTLSQRNFIPYISYNGMRLDPDKATAHWYREDIFWRHKDAPPLHIK